MITPEQRPLTSSVQRRTGWRRTLVPATALLFAVMTIVALVACRTEPVVKEPAVMEVSIEGGDRVLAVDETAQLEASVEAVGGATSDLRWSSSDAPVVSVDDAGVVTAGAVGSATITATSVFDATVSDSVVVTVVEPDAPAPSAFRCDEIDEGEPGPTLVCESDDGAVHVRIPWQGEDVRVSALSVEGLFRLPSEDDFEPLSDWPLLHLAVTDAATGAPRQAFSPPMTLRVRYGAADFAAAGPAVGEGELGLGVWDSASESWIVVGYGVFHEGFWLADPRAGGGIDLVPDRVSAQPRFQLSGSPAEGEAISLVAATLPSLPLAWGAMPPDPEHMLKEFDGPCQDVVLDGVPAVECVASEVGLTVRVPVQAYGTVTPRVIALPWNRASTFEVDEGVWSSAEQEGPLIRRLMNFLVVDADTGALLTEFRPPMEFEIAYAAEDKDPVVNPMLLVTYWDEYVEQVVVLGGGDTNVCTLTAGGTSPNCLWGDLEEAGPTTDPRFDQGAGFFLTDAEDPDRLGGIAKFTYDRWGDRMVMLVR